MVCNLKGTPYPAPQYKLTSRVFKNPLSISQINSHLRLSISGNLYLGKLTNSEYLLDARETGGSNATAYAANLRIRFIPDKTNTTEAVTVNIFGIGSVALKKSDGTNFAVGELKDNYIYTFVYAAAVTGPPAVVAMFKQSTTLTDEENEFDYYFYNCMAIVQWIEKFISRDIFRKTYKVLMTGFNREIELKKSPFVSLESFRYLKDNTNTDVDNDSYKVVTQNYYSLIYFLEDYQTPQDADNVPQNVEINFTTGMFSTIQEVDSEIIQAMLLILASLNQYRGDCIDSYNSESFNVLSNIPPQAQNILRQYQIVSIW